MEQNRIFNEKLKFSWGHIIAAIALVAIAYCTYVGTVYLIYNLKWRFIWAGIITFVVVVLLGMLFFIPQQLKGTEHRFDKRIKWERAFIFLSPVLFLLLMVPFSHAWTVHHRQDRILERFHEVMDKTDQMFVAYEQYSDRRMKKLAEQLDRDSSIANYTSANKREILQLALRSYPYDTIKNVAQKWMKEEARKPTLTTWNIFLLGNIDSIQGAIHGWHGALQHLSEFSWECEDSVARFDNDGQMIGAIDNIIKGDNKESLTSYYGNIEGFSLITIIWLVLGYAMLLFPYLLQPRHSKTIGTRWSLFRTRKPKPTEHHDEDNDHATFEDDDDDDFTPNMTETPPPTAPSSDGDDDFASVKI